MSLLICGSVRKLECDSCFHATPHERESDCAKSECSSLGDSPCECKEHACVAYWVGDKPDRVHTHITSSAADDSGKHYRFEFQGVKMDPYRILKVYGITDPAQQHAIKKLLRAGRSVKSFRRDVEEVISTLNRLLEMLEEEDK